MIVVTGANGHLGRGVVEHLLRHLPAAQIAVSVRDPDKAVELARLGVEVRRGDFAETATLAEAFRGARRLLLISTDVTGPTRVGLHRNAVEAARVAQVEHLVYTSAIDPDPQSPFSPAADHAATEAAIRESGLRYTLLRNSFYMETLPLLLQGAVAGGPVAAPADGSAAYAARMDLAEATANLLAGGGYEGRTLELTGPLAVDLAEAARIVAAILGRPVERLVLTDEEYRSQLLAVGMPPAGVAVFLQIFAALRESRFANVSPALGELLGRTPQAPETFLRAALTTVQV
jgi:NAD(P)H dehydrogenase (quinone)